MKKLCGYMFYLFASAPVIAQDRDVQLDAPTNSNGSWYASPLVWLVGGAILIGLLLAILKSNRRELDSD
jgi:hypothetical protein